MMSEPVGFQEPAIIVIFGITGDLSQRYLLPSLYRLIKAGALHEQTEIIGVSRRDQTSEAILQQLENTLKQRGRDCDPAILEAMGSRLSMSRMDLDDTAAYASLRAKLDGIEDAQGVCMHRLFYLSIPPQAYDPVIRLLGENGLNAGCRHGNADSRLLIEKPFGFDLRSAEKLIAETAKSFKEDQIFRIDHYMAKITVQNMLDFRARNPEFEAVWNRDYIESVEIITKEKIGIEGRAVFYEQSGALRDIIQSHHMQILGVTLMDQRTATNSQALHVAKQALLEKIEPVPPDKARQRAQRGQYKGYRQEVNNPASTTETYAAVTLFTNTPRWEGVPARLITGKNLDERLTEIRINFKKGNDKDYAQLRFRAQPNEAIELEMTDGQIRQLPLDYSLQTDTTKSHPPEAYEKVIVDAIHGDHTLFSTAEEVLDSWRILQPVLNVWSAQNDDLIIYEPGSQEPELPSI
jgi:glucose-6-phosphate 1-dehydrogenase